MIDMQYHGRVFGWRSSTRAAFKMIPQKDLESQSQIDISRRFMCDCFYLLFFFFDLNYHLFLFLQ